MPGQCAGPRLRPRRRRAAAAAHRGAAGAGQGRGPVAAVGAAGAGVVDRADRRPAALLPRPRRRRPGAHAVARGGGLAHLDRRVRRASGRRGAGIAGRVPADRPAAPFVARAQAMLAPGGGQRPGGVRIRARGGAAHRVADSADARPGRHDAAVPSRDRRSRRPWREAGGSWTARRADLVRAVLVLCADHELNVSSFTARCVASAGSTPYAVVIAGLAALEGPRHGGSSARAEAMLDRCSPGTKDLRRALAARLPARRARRRLRPSALPAGRSPRHGHPGLAARALSGVAGAGLRPRRRPGRDAHDRRASQPRLRAGRGVAGAAAARRARRSCSLPSAGRSAGSVTRSSSTPPAS